MKESIKKIDVVSLKLVREKSAECKIKKCLSSQEAYDLVRDYIEDKDREHFLVVGLNNKNEPNVISTVHIGTIDSSLASPKDIFKVALLSNSNNIIVAHNHPSGNPTPSKQDEKFTKKLIKAGKLMDINIMDHIIVGYSDVGRNYFSFAENKSIK